MRRLGTAALLLGVVLVATGGVGGDLVANPGSLLRSIAAKSATLSTLVGRSNATLDRIHESLGPLEQLDRRMARLADETGEARRRTRRIARSLRRLDRSVGREEAQLAAVAAQLRTLDAELGRTSAETGRSLQLTNGMSSSFARVERSLGGVAVSLDRLLAAMGRSVPKVSYFARNRLLRGTPGGLPARYRAPNVAVGTRVMSVMLPMIRSLQFGGVLVARKDGATASSEFILDLLNQQVPDGTNVRSTIHRFDSRHGLPPPGYFVSRAVGGF